MEIPVGFTEWRGRYTPVPEDAIVECISHGGDKFVDYARQLLWGSVDEDGMHAVAAYRVVAMPDGAPIPIAPPRDYRRERFEVAKAALQGLLAGPLGDDDHLDIAEEAVAFGDALIAELDKK